MAQRPKALVTNDDGIRADGIRYLAQAAHECGWDVTVAAPANDASGSSASLLVTEDHERIVVQRHQLAGLPDVPAYGVAASPGFITMIATRGAFGEPPDVVLSGVNHGANAGRVVLHSGTVGAAVTGAVNGCRGLAVSLDIGLRGNGSPQWDTARQVVGELLPELLAAPDRTVLNVNVPDAPYDQVRGVRRATLARFGAVQMTIDEIGEGFICTSLEESDAEHDEDSDLTLLGAGYVTVTPLRPFTEATEVALPGIPRPERPDGHRPDRPQPGPTASEPQEKVEPSELALRAHRWA